MRGVRTVLCTGCGERPVLLDDVDFGTALCDDCQARDGLQSNVRDLLGYSERDA